MEITKKRLIELERSERMLAALEAGGVDNWEGYDISLEEYRAENELDEKREDLLQEICEALCEGIDEPAGSGAGFGFLQSAIDSAYAVIARSGVTFKS